jgi:hypothetical protein
MPKQKGAKGVSKPIEFGFHVFPRSGFWHQRMHIEILTACDEVPELSGVQLPWWSFTSGHQGDIEGYADVSSSGFSWLGVGTVRFYGLDCEYARPCGESGGDWRALIEVDDDEEIEQYRRIIPTGEYRRGDTCVNAFECRASEELPVDKVVSLMRVFVSKGHVVLATTGFSVTDRIYNDPTQYSIARGTRPVIMANMLKELRRKQNMLEGGWALSDLTCGAIMDGRVGRLSVVDRVNEWVMAHSVNGIVSADAATGTMAARC